MALARSSFRLAACAFFAVQAAAAWATITATVFPASPRYLEPVYLRLDPGPMAYDNFYGAQVSMAGTTITVRYQWMPEVGGYSYDVMLGRFPTGSYTVNVETASAGTVTAQFTVGAPQVSTAHPGNVPAVNYTDLWWNPAEPGWGLSVLQGPTNQLFAVWFVYGADGKPTWYTLQPGSWTSANFYTAFSGPVYRTSGPYFGGAFDPSGVGVTPVGTGTLSFRDAMHGEFRYTIDGVSSSKRLQREPIE